MITTNWNNWEFIGYEEEHPCWIGFFAHTLSFNVTFDLLYPNYIYKQEYILDVSGIIARKSLGIQNISNE
jgi:hypothetical protein